MPCPVPTPEVAGDTLDHIVYSPTNGLVRREFLRRACIIAAAAVGLPKTAAAAFYNTTVVKGNKPSVIWLHFQECTGCTESLLRTEHPPLDDLLVDLISLDYHETLLVAAGHQAEAARRQAMKRHAGKYILVVEGSIPTADGGIYCKIGGQTALEMVNESAAQAGAIIAIGSCASWGGVASASPNPTGATGVHEVLKNKTVVNIPGCPANPYSFLGTALQYATFGTLPALDDKNRPKFAYGRTIHDDCPRRGHFDAGRFAHQFGDEGHREGHCLYLLGCKGPYTHAPCALNHFGEVIGAWPVGIGAPCIGCTEQAIGFKIAAYDKMELEPSKRPLLGSQIPDPKKAGGGVNTILAGTVGVAGGVLTAMGIAAAKNGGSNTQPEESSDGH